MDVLEFLGESGVEVRGKRPRVVRPKVMRIRLLHLYRCPPRFAPTLCAAGVMGIQAQHQYPCPPGFPTRLCGSLVRDLMFGSAAGVGPMAEFSEAGLEWSEVSDMAGVDEWGH